MEERSVPITRDQLLGGLVGRQVGAVMYAIESRTAYLAIRARHAAAPAMSEGLVEEEERAFLGALAAGRDLPISPHIQELEQFAPQWAYLAPRSAAIRADVAHRVGNRHRFQARDVPRIRAALGLDEEAVRQAYLTRHGRSLDSIYADTRTGVDRWRWWRAGLTRRLEELPPFWTAFGLTLTQTVGAGMLALPIALAGVGPIPGVVLVILLGLLNVLTIAATAETFVRTGSVRWRGAYFGRVVTEYLGQPGRVSLALSLGLRNIFALLAFYLGFAATLFAATGVTAVVWVAVIFAADVIVIRRKRLHATVASALLVGTVNIAAILLLVALAVPHIDLDNLTYVGLPFVDGRPFDASVLALVFGVVLLAYFGHTSVANCARVVLLRDQTGHSLIRGAVTATITAIAIYGLWVAVIGGVVAPERLAAERGTALTPLAELTGPLALVVGTVFAALAMGMVSIHVSLGLYNSMNEMLRSARRRAALALLPIGVVFLAAVVAVATERGSFARVLNLTGAILIPLVAGIIPMLLIVASRRRGDYVVAWRWRWLGHPVVAVAVAAVFFVAVALHGLVIWEPPAERLLALTVAVTSVVLTIVVIRSGAFAPLAVVEVRRDELGRDSLLVTCAGTTISTQLLPIGTRQATVELHALRARELRIWAHKSDPSGESEPLPVMATLRSGDRTTAVPLTDGSADLRLDPTGHHLDVRLPAVSPVGQR